MKKLLIMSVVLLLATGALWAQGFGGRNGGGAGNNTIMVNTTKGLFVLRAGVLAKYDPATLKLTQELQLFGPAPTRPDTADQDAFRKYIEAMALRNAPALMLVKDTSLLIVIGEGFTRIDQETLKANATADLRLPGATAETTTMQAPEPAPGYLLVDNTLYLLRSKEIMSLSITDGKIINRNPLPTELQSVSPFGGRGGRGGFGGGNGGNGGNGGGGHRGGGNQNPPAGGG